MDKDFKRIDQRKQERVIVLKKMVELDIHDYKRKLEQGIVRVKTSKISDRNKELSLFQGVIPCNQCLRM